MKKIKNLLVFSMLALALITTSSCKKVCNPVSASFTYTYTFTEGGINITFNNTSTDAKDYKWEFGNCANEDCSESTDLSSSIEKNPVLNYGGYYLFVKLTAKNGKSSATATTIIDIRS